MKYANLHHHHQHQLQDQLVGSCSLSTRYGAASNHHSWTPNTNSLTIGNYNDNINEENLLAPSSTSSMIQDLGFQYWTNNTSGSCFTTTDHDQSDFLPKFTEMLQNSSPSTEDHLHLPPSTTIYTKNEQKYHFNQFSGGDQFQYSNNAPNNCSSFGGGLGIVPSRGSFSQIFPSVNISNLSATRPSSIMSSSLGMNLEALDLLTPARFNGNFSELSHDNLGLVKESSSFASHHMKQQSIHKPPIIPNYKISPFINGVTEAKRASNTTMEPKSSQAAAKKSRLETRACPPFKVRKEKLGERIAALQPLVAPFGKTDTASVLTEAIGYIKFLQNQIEGHIEGYGSEDTKRDLRSRGLCLVPLSCMSYVTNDGGDIWPHANYYGYT